jgi:hypothetical protein
LGQNIERSQIHINEDEGLIMINWIKRLFGFRVSFKSRTPVIDRKFPRLKTLDRRVAAAREIENEAD